jgi:hypothetical protein
VGSSDQRPVGDCHGRNVEARGEIVVSYTAHRSAAKSFSSSDCTLMLLHYNFFNI